MHWIAVPSLQDCYYELWQLWHAPGADTVFGLALFQWSKELSQCFAFVLCHSVTDAVPLTCAGRLVGRGGNSVIAAVHSADRNARDKSIVKHEQGKSHKVVVSNSTPTPACFMHRITLAHAAAAITRRFWYMHVNCNHLLLHVPSGSL